MAFAPKSIYGGRVAILAFVEQADDRRALDARNRIEPVRHCAGVDELVHRILADAARGAVVDVDVWPSWATGVLERGVPDARKVTPLWLRLDPTPSALGKLPRLAMLPCVLQVSMRTFDAPERWLAEELDQPRSATIPTLRRLNGKFAASAQRLFTAALVLAEQVASETEVAAAVGVSARELRRRFAMSGLPAFPATIGALFALHAAWRFSELGWTTKRACVAAGYAEAKPFEKYVRAHTGLTPRQLRDNGGYSLMLERIEQWPDNVARQGKSSARPSGTVAETDGSLAGFGGIPDPADV